MCEQHVLNSIHLTAIHICTQFKVFGNRKHTIKKYPGVVQRDSYSHIVYKHDKRSMYEKIFAIISHKTGILSRFFSLFSNKNQSFVDKTYRHKFFPH